MKAKLLATLFLGFIVSAFAVGQSLVLSYEGEILEPNAEVTKEGTATDEIIVEMDVTNTSGAAMDVLLQRYEEDMVPGSQSAICWGGLCYPPNVSLSPSATNIGAGQTVLAECQLHYYPNGNPGVSTISYTLFDAANANDSVFVTVLYDGLMTSIEVNYGLEANVYPNPANENVTIALEGEMNDNSIVELMTLTGAVVAKAEIHNNKARINTTNIAEGLYFYQVKSNQTATVSGRIIIQH
ncbi:MAG: T9SS type A sorting domain-containing protein [Bacteroidetes bacterium]|nr:T9SS type A sorting domain-containing protein [Bacteroidota bacterium]